MLAIVCDCCGKVRLLDGEEIFHRPTGFKILSDDGNFPSKIDLCEECAEQLMAAVRKEKVCDSL